MLASAPLLIPKPWVTVSLLSAHINSVNALVALRDGSFLSLSDDDARRWVINSDNTTNCNVNDDTKSQLRVVGTYIGHTEPVTGAVEKDDNTIVTASYYSSLKVWNKMTCECLLTIPLPSLITCVAKTRDGSRLICGYEDGLLEWRRMSDFQVIHTLQLIGFIKIVWELEDGTFILTVDNVLERWDISNRTMLQRLGGDSRTLVVTELNRDHIVTMDVSDGEGAVKIREASTGECLHSSILLDQFVQGLVNVTEGHFATGSSDNVIRLWDEFGNNYATYDTIDRVFDMIRLADGSIVTYEIKSDASALLVIRKQ